MKFIKGFLIANIQTILVCMILFILFSKQFWSGYFVELEITTILFSLFLPVIVIIYNKLK